MATKIDRLSPYNIADDLVRHFVSVSIRSNDRILGHPSCAARGILIAVLDSLGAGGSQEVFHVSFRIGVLI